MHNEMVLDGFKNYVRSSATKAYRSSHKLMHSEHGYEFTEEDFKDALRDNLGIK